MAEGAARWREHLMSLAPRKQIPTKNTAGRVEQLDWAAFHENSMASFSSNK